MGIPWKFHENGNKTPVWKWEWEGTLKTVDGNGELTHLPMGKNYHGFFVCCCRLAVDLSSLYSSYNTTV